jgi:hypothetical protein
MQPGNDDREQRSRRPYAQPERNRFSLFRSNLKVPPRRHLHLLTPALTSRRPTHLSPSSRPPSSSSSSSPSPPNPAAASTSRHYLSGDTRNPGSAEMVSRTEPNAVPSPVAGSEIPERGSRPLGGLLDLPKDLPRLGSADKRERGRRWGGGTSGTKSPTR